MKIINQTFPTDKPTAITIGKFEAIHLGHLCMIDSTIEHAKTNGLASAVLSFVPHPAQVLSDTDYKPLFTHEEKMRILSQSDLDYWVPYPFNQETIRKSPGDFCEMLKSQFYCRTLLVGSDFRYGHNRTGTTESLIAQGKELGIEVVVVPTRHDSNKIITSHDSNKNTTSHDSNKISTSLIRELLSYSKIKEANQLLSMPFFLMGEVKRGKQLGRTLGFPTANLHMPEDKFLPPDGVYSSGVFLKSGQFYTAVTNIGTNPTVHGNTEIPSRKAETHILNFDSSKINDKTIHNTSDLVFDIYDEEIVVELYEFIRPEMKFSGLDELKKQIAKDVKWCRKG